MTQLSFLVTLFTLVGLMAGAVAFFCKVHAWYLHQQQQTRELENLRQKHTRDTQKINKENQLVIYALSACLDGLSQLGANHSVPKAKEALDQHLNQQAHQ